MSGAPPDRNKFYGAIVHEARLGPKRELALSIELWPKGKQSFNVGEGEFINVRFGAIVNYDEVQRFFAALPSESLHYLKESPKRTAAGRVFELEYDRTGDRLSIVAAHAEFNSKDEFI